MGNLHDRRSAKSSLSRSYLNCGLKAEKAPGKDPGEAQSTQRAGQHGKKQNHSGFLRIVLRNSVSPTYARSTIYAFLADLYTLVKEIR